MILHLLASAMSRVEPSSALHLLETLVSEAPDYREGLVSLAALQLRCGNAASAATTLDRLLRRFAVPRTEMFEALAARIARQDGCAGWAGVAGNGQAQCSAAGFSLAFDAARPFLASSSYGWNALPQAWRKATFLHVVSRHGRILGASIHLSAIRHVEGVVAFDPAFGLRGWALAPADPDTPMIIDIFAGRAGKPFASVVADEAARALGHVGGAQHARGFRIPPAMMQATGTLHVRARDGAEMTGSPIHPRVESNAARHAARRAKDPWRPLPVILTGLLPPAARTTPGRAALDVLIVLNVDDPAMHLAVRPADLPPGTRIVGVASGRTGQMAHSARSDAGLIDIILANPRKSGTTACINTGLRHAGARDVLILAPQVRLPEGAVGRLLDAAYAAPDIGTVTPLTHHRGITALGAPATPSDISPEEFSATNDILRMVNAGISVDMPACTGDCILIRHDCRLQSGLFREDAFPYGPGAEEDFARRAAVLGWRHVAACDVMVAGDGNAGIGEAVRTSLQSDAVTLLERLHPGYGGLKSAFLAQDPLRGARAACEAKTWEHGRCRAAIVLVTHDSGGGVERHVSERVAAIRARGLRAIVVRPRSGFAISDGMQPTHPNLTFASVDDLAAFLAADRPCAVELHHIAEHEPGIEKLAGKLRVPFDYVLHDYAAICPRITCCPAGAYCGAPEDTRVCDDCVADHGSQMPFSGTVAALREKHALLLRAARRVVVATEQSSRTLKRFFKGLQPAVVPWEDDARWPPIASSSSGRSAHVGVVGGIGTEKGYFVLLACARDAARRGLPLRFSVIGHTIDDKRLQDTGRVFVTGPFAEGEASALLRQASPTCGFLPSIWPETWCYALSALWEAGLHVIAFDLGAQSERIRARGAGTLMPPGSLPAALNDYFLEFSAVQESNALG